MRQFIVLLSCVVSLASCRMPSEVEKAKPPPPRSAVLLSESNVELARQESWTQGPGTYSNVVLGLQSALSTKGLIVDIVTEDDLVRDRLRNYRALFIVETFSITRQAEDAIRRYVQSGGTLVGIHEVGRYQSEWTKPWHYEDVFGVEAQKTDPYGTGLSEAADLYRRAEWTPAGLRHHLTSGLGSEMDFGPACAAIWVTKPTTATALAEFPAYSALTQDDAHDTHLVQQPAVALSVNDFGKGKAVWISANIHARKAGNWVRAPEVLELLARCQNLAAADLVIPPQPAQVILGMSQLGYAPGEKKHAVIRVPRESSKPFFKADFEIIAQPSGKKVLGGKLIQEGPENPWRDYYYIADFSTLSQDGTYQFAAELSGPRGQIKVKSGDFQIATSLWTSVVEPMQYSFFGHYRCGVECHSSDPIRGGFHDATGDYAVRMWSMPHVAYGFAENILSSPARNTAAVDELRHAVDWMLAMEDPRGIVWNCVKPPGDFSPTDTRPAKDPTRRVLDKSFNLNYQTTYIAGMAHAARALKGYDPERSAKAIEAAIKACNYLGARDWQSEKTGEVGNFIWDNAEMYLATGTTAYLARAKSLAPILLDRQFLEPDKAQYGICGDFFDNRSRKGFGDKQYKKFHSLGIYLGLVELAGLLPQDDPLLVSITNSLDAFFNNYLLRSSTLTPYGQMTTALEPSNDGSFRVFFFTHPKSWVRLHGLNVDHFAMAFVALKYADLRNRADLRGFALAQSQWVVGMNPLGYSMIDTIGWAQAPMLDGRVGTGRFAGGIPNGIVGDPDDCPLWGDTWDSREYWLPHNAYLLAIAPHLDEAAGKLGE